MLTLPLKLLLVRTLKPFVFDSTAPAPTPLRRGEGNAAPSAAGEGGNSP